MHCTLRTLRGAAALALVPALAAGAQSLPGTEVYSGTGGTAWGGMTRTFALDGNPDVAVAGLTSFSVRINGLSYATRESGDLKAYLLVSGVGTSDNGWVLPLFEVGAPPGGGGYATRNFQGNYSFSTAFAAPLTTGADGSVAPGDYAFALDASSVLARIGNLGGVGAPARISLALYDDYALNGVASFTSFEVSIGRAPVSSVPEPGTWALVGSGLLALGTVARRRARR